MQIKSVERQAKNSPISGVAEDSLPRRDQIQDFYLQSLYGGTKYFQSRTPPSISREASEDLLHGLL